MGIASMLPLRALLLAAATICASGFAPYAGPDLESFDFDYQGLRIAAPLLGAGQLGPGEPPQFGLPDLYHPCFVNGAPFGPSPGTSYSMGMDLFLSPEKRLSVISELDELFGNPSAEVATSGPVFQLQQLYSDFCEGEGKKFDCIQPGSGAGYYVVPAGESPSLFGPPETATPHNSFSNPIDGFFAPGGTEVWQADKTFEWLLATAFGK